MVEPLAIKLAPKHLSDIIGQEELVSKDKVLYNLVRNKYLFSMILYGNPGIGKTSIAKALVNDLGFNYKLLNAVINKKSDFEEAIEEAKLNNGLVLLVDEIHRMNKDKQDILLPYLENGLITLIGMTTSNPYHAINPAIRSRCHIFELKPLTEDNIIKGIKKATKSDFLKGIKIDTKSIKQIAFLANNDLRSAYNILELAFFSSSDKVITLDLLKTINVKSVMSFDKSGDGYYDTLSALQKSIRGSDVNASLLYLGKLLEAGDLDSLARRLSVICYEDIGLANPSLGPKLDAAINAAFRVGFPECKIVLAPIVIEMSLSPKSNSACSAIFSVLDDIEKGIVGPIPETIRINSRIYKYPHDYPGSWVKQQYMPDNLLDKKYYIPKENKYESALKTVIDSIDKMKKD